AAHAGSDPTAQASGEQLEDSGDRPTAREAAEAAGPSKRAPRGWLKERAFLAAYRQARRDVLEAAVTRLTRAAGKAVDALVAVLDKGGAGDADMIKAAGLLLDLGYEDLQTWELEDRLRELKERIAEQKAPWAATYRSETGPRSNRPGGPCSRPTRP